jgi:hypothetical protein
MQRDITEIRAMAEEIRADHEAEGK